VVCQYKCFWNNYGVLLFCSTSLGINEMRMLCCSATGLVSYIQQAHENFQYHAIYLKEILFLLLYCRCSLVFPSHIYY
jgi:hypothetical protein